MIDLHCHVLPGIDDGPATLDGALAIVRAAADDGTTTMVATPHVGWDWPDNDAARIAAAVADLCVALGEAGIRVDVMPGAEVAVTRAVDLPDEELAALRLGGGPWLLVEPPFSPAGAAGLEHALQSLAARGHRLVIAHPERCPALLHDRPLLERLVGAGMLCSLTAGSLVGRFGREPQRFAEGLLRAGLVHDIASDAHDPGPRRPPSLASDMHAAGLGEHAAWFGEHAPAAILAGRPLPAPPVIAPGRPRGLARLLRRA